MRRPCRGKTPYSDNNNYYYSHLHCPWYAGASATLPRDVNPVNYVILILDVRLSSTRPSLRRPNELYCQQWVRCRVVAVKSPRRTSSSTRKKKNKNYSHILFVRRAESPCSWSLRAATSGDNSKQPSDIMNMAYASIRRTSSKINSAIARMLSARCMAFRTHWHRITLQLQPYYTRTIVWPSPCLSRPPRARAHPVHFDSDLASPLHSISSPFLGFLFLFHSSRKNYFFFSSFRCGCRRHGGRCYC